MHFFLLAFFFVGIFSHKREMEEEKGLCRETFVREAIRAMEEAMKTTRTTTTKGGFTKEEEEEEEGSTFIKTVFFGSKIVFFGSKTMFFWSKNCVFWSKNCVFW